jgi:hypothetical protein
VCCSATTSDILTCLACAQRLPQPTDFDTSEKNAVNFAILTTTANITVSYIPDGHR